MLKEKAKKSPPGTRYLFIYGCLLIVAQPILALMLCGTFTLWWFIIEAFLDTGFFPVVAMIALVVWTLCMGIALSFSLYSMKQFGNRMDDTERSRQRIRAEHQRIANLGQGDTHHTEMDELDDETLAEIEQRYSQHSEKR